MNSVCLKLEARCSEVRLSAYRVGALQSLAKAFVFSSSRASVAQEHGTSSGFDWRVVQYVLIR